ncbi:MAG: tetratricopeptide repeat protein [Acidobacteriaceae bacterium]
MGRRLQIRYLAACVARVVALSFAVLSTCFLPSNAQSQNRNAESDQASASCTAGDNELAAGKWRQAVQDYGVCAKAYPQNFAVFSNMGIALSRLGQMEEAIQSYQKALSLDPTNTKVKFNLAVALVKAEDYPDAIKRLRELQQTGGDLRYDELLAFCYFHVKSYNLAAQAAEKVYAINPDDAANALILGETYTRLHQYDKALPLITKALQVAGSAEGHLILAQTLIGLRMFHEAEAELNQVVKINPDLPGLHTAIGSVDIGTDRTRQAEAEFTIALAQNPSDFEANYLMGRLKRFDGDIPSATHYLDVAATLHPSSPEVMFERASIAITQRRYADAIPLLQGVLKAEPDYAQAYLMLSVCYQRTGKKQEAQKAGEMYATMKRDAQAKPQSP